MSILANSLLLYLNDSKTVQKLQALRESELSLHERGLANLYELGRNTNSRDSTATEQFKKLTMLIWRRSIEPTRLQNQLRPKRDRNSICPLVNLMLRHYVPWTAETSLLISETLPLSTVHTP